MTLVLFMSKLQSILLVHHKLNSVVNDYFFISPNKESIKGYNYGYDKKLSHSKL